MAGGTVPCPFVYIALLSPASPWDAFGPILPNAWQEQWQTGNRPAVCNGKSVFLAARVLLDALTGRSTLVVRQVARTLRASCFIEVQKCMERFRLTHLFQVNRTEVSLTCLTNSAQLLFLGLDDIEKIKSITPLRGALTDIWVEEATETSWADIKQLEKRLRGLSRHKKRLTLSFNPVSRGHWL